MNSAEPSAAAPSGTTPLLTLAGLVGERQGLRLWGPLTARLGAGAAVHVQGPNGCGKTTLLRTVAGLRRPAAGTVEPAAACWFIGHATPLAEDLGAQANLRLWLDLAGHAAVADADISRWLKQWSLPSERPVRQFSAGQRRKLALAPLALAPRLLWLLDEPFDALDTAGCVWLAGAATAHLSGGGLVLLSSHQALPAAFPACKSWWLGRRTRAGTALAESP